MLKAARRLRKKAFKFKFTVEVHQVDVVHAAGLAPLPLMVAWTRGPRKAYTPASFVKGGVVAWNAPLSMVVTLYQETDGSGFEKKEYKFALKEGSSGSKGGKKTLASATLDLATYASLDVASQGAEIPLKPNSSLVRSAALSMTITSQFVRESADDDALTQLSAMSWRTADEMALVSSDAGGSGGGGAGGPSDAAYRNEFLRETEAYASLDIDAADDRARIAELETQIEMMRSEAAAAAASWEAERADYMAMVDKLKGKVARERAKTAEAKAAAEAAAAASTSAAQAGAAGAAGGEGVDAAQLNKYRTLAKQLQAEVEALEGDLTAVEDENDALVAKCQTLAKAKAKAEAAAAAAAASAAAAVPTSPAGPVADSDTVAELKQELASAHVQIREYEAQVEALSRRLSAPGFGRTSSASGEIQGLTAQLVAKDAKLETAATMTQELETALIDAKMAAAEAAFEAETLRGEKRSLAKQLAKAKLAFNAMSERITELEVQNIT